MRNNALHFNSVLGDSVLRIELQTNFRFLWNSPVQSNIHSCMIDLANKRATLYIGCGTGCTRPICQFCTIV